jgi:hypothetical protein
MRSRSTFLCTLLVLQIILSYPQSSNASTPLAWSAQSVAPVGGDEMQALFGTNVFSASSNLNWSMRITPTELGKKVLNNEPFIYYAIPACTKSILIGCIEKVEYKKSDQNWLPATLSKKEITNRNGEISPSGRNSSGVISNSEINEWPADLENHAPAAGRASYWNFSQAPHGGGSEYLLRVNIAGINSAAPTWSNGKVQRYLEMGIFPVDGFTEYQFPDDLQIKVRLKLGPIAKDLWGWFDGRVINPNVTLDFESADGIVEIAGAPSNTPMGITTKKKISEIGPEILSMYDCPAGLSPSLCPSKAGLKRLSTDGNVDINSFAKYEKEFGAISTIGVKSEWWIKTTRWPDVATVKDCPSEQNGFTGIVTTNATMYGTSAPMWDPSDKTFSFQVASPHLGIDGSPNTGYYSLVLPKSLAECRWGKNISQSKIVISIVAADGNRTVGTSNYSIKNNLLTFNAAGFTYSSPVIKIGLAATPNLTPAKKVTITCIKGKVVKKLSGIKPSCPTGYKRK